MHDVQFTLSGPLVIFIYNFVRDLVVNSWLSVGGGKMIFYSTNFFCFFLFLTDSSTLFISIQRNKILSHVVLLNMKKGWLPLLPNKHANLFSVLTFICNTNIWVEYCFKGLPKGKLDLLPYAFTQIPNLELP